jgi:hypothetical protein
VGENQRRVRARPFPKSEIEAVHIDDAELRIFFGGSKVHGSIFAWRYGVVPVVSAAGVWWHAAETAGPSKTRAGRRCCQ